MLRSWLRRFVVKLQRFELRLNTEECVSHGLRIAITSPGRFGTTEHMLEKIEQALQLIADYQPWRLMHVRRDLRFIWIVRRASSRACYMPQHGCCVLDTYFVANHEPEEVAASIIHASIHARLSRIGVGRTVARDERICRRAEVSFGRRIPNGARVLARAERELVRDTEEFWATLDHDEIAGIDRRAEIVEADLPKWVERWLLRRAGLM